MRFARGSRVAMATFGVLTHCSSASEDGFGPGASGPHEVRASDAGFQRDGSVYDSAPSPDSGLGVLRFSPTQAFSGYDGSHAFKVPVAVYDAASDLRVTVADPSAATIAPTTLENPINQDGIADTGTYFLVTVTKATTIRLEASSGGRTAALDISVTDYAADRWPTGEARYLNGGTSGDPPCTTCHAGGQAIDHSPAALASRDDPTVAAVISTGISTAGFPIQGVPGGHRWQVTEEERAGLVTYLRGLDPRGFE